MPHSVFRTAHGTKRNETMTKITAGCQQLSTNERNSQECMKLKTASCCDIGTQDTHSPYEYL